MLARFCRYNKWKLLLLPIIYTSACYTFFWYFANDENRGYEVTGTLVLSGLLLILSLGYSLLNFGVIEDLLTDTSGTSICALFDNGYTISMDGKWNPFFFSEEAARVQMNGMPVTIWFENGHYKGRYPPSVKFSFHPLYHARKGAGQRQNISFDLGAGNKFTKDIKPELLGFIAGLYEQGYTPAPSDTP